MLFKRLSRAFSGLLLHPSLRTTKWRSWIQFSSDASEGFQYQATTISLLSKEEEENIYIVGYGTTGFLLNSGIRIIGPCVLFPRSVLHWNVGSAQDINEDALSLFTMLDPKLDILVIGMGSQGAQCDPKIIKYLRSNKINVEILPTDHACETFNFLNSEHRYVAGAFIPPAKLESDFDEDTFKRFQQARDEALGADFDVREFSEQIKRQTEKQKLLEKKQALEKSVKQDLEEKK